jgi:hypothetical protein
MEHKEHRIEGPLDYLVARTQLETDIAREILERARGEGDYHREKAAAKLVAFHENEEQMLALYAEAKRLYPELAETLERRRPHLLELLKEAELLWQSV